ncbi:MAG: ABC transporter ATP-binding protein [Peptococcaceae bacterium]|nr:ABC transporter ATP-binding protein [Peptococcaceae bacterium]
MIRTILGSVREYKKATFQTIFFAGIESVFEIVIPFWMSYLIDRGIEAGDMRQVALFGGLLLLFAALQCGSGVAAAYRGSYASAGFSANLREDMFARVQTFSFANIDKFSTSSIVTRLTTDITYVRNAYNMMIRMAVRSPMMMIFAVVAAFNIDREVSMIFLFVLPVLAVALGLIIYFSFPLFSKIFTNYDKLNNVVQEDVRGIRVVKSFNQEGYEINKFNAVSAVIRKIYTRAECIIALNGPAMQISMYTCMMLISWFGARAIIASGNDAALGLTTGALTALFTYAIQILMSMMMLSMVFVMILISSAPIRRISEILTEESTIQDPENPVMQVRDGEVCFEHVNFHYRDESDKEVLSDICLRFPSGSTIGILGATGSSKSSLVQLIPRLYDVTSGRVLVGGVDVRDYDLDVLRGEVAMVLQKNELFSGTIADNLRWGNENASDEELRHVCHLACADEFIDQMPDGYNTHIDQGGSNVSGGQKQRLCIARALLKQPKILILDDSTSAVDTRTDALIQRGLKEYIPSTTKIIIAQRVSSLAHADQIVVLDDGRVNATGTHEELLATCDIYRDVYESQQKGALEE